MSNPADADLYQLIDGMPAMLAAFDRNGRSAYRNHACRAFFGRGDGAENSEESWISDLVLEDDPEVRSCIDSRSEVRFERELTGIDGMRRFEVSLIPSVSPNGDVHGYVAIAREAADGGNDTIGTGDSAASILDSLPDAVPISDQRCPARPSNSKSFENFPTDTNGTSAAP